MKVLRYEVPVDDNQHTMWVAGPIKHVETRSPHKVEFWTLSRSIDNPVERTFQVYGTGHSVPDGTEFIGTALVPGGALVWHLFEFIPFPQCENHKPVQHRDGKPPWCRSCGLTAEFNTPISRIPRD